MRWTYLNNIELLNKLLLAKNLSIFAIFKHSIRCPLSAAVKKRIEGEWAKYNPNTELYLLDLINNRDISNKVAELLKVQHQSPQLILVKNGEVVYDASHLAISAKKASTYI